MKRFLLIYFLIVGSVFPQAGRPPVTTLNGLTDVTLTSPSDGQALIYDSGTSQWINSVVPGGALSSLSDVQISVPSDGDFLRYNGTSSYWENVGPLKFSDLTGNIAVSQMASGSGASSTTYWRGDNTWATPPTGAIQFTNNLLAGDNSGNAISASGLTLVPPGLYWNQQGNFTTEFAVSNPDSLNTNVIARIYAQTGSTLSLTSYGPAFATSGLTSAGDGVIANDGSDINIIVPATFVTRFSNDGGTNQRAAIGTGVMVGPTTVADKGVGTVNVSSGYYVNGSKVGGGTVITSTVDQTATTETSHISYAVPANSAVVGSTFRISAWGNIDNGTTAVTFTPRIRWGGTSGVVIMSTPTIVGTTTSQTNKDWSIVARVTLRTLGGSGTAVGDMTVTNHTASSSGVFAIDHATTGASAISFLDTTSSISLTLTWTLSTTTGTPHVRTFGGTIELISP